MLQQRISLHQLCNSPSPTQPISFDATPPSPAGGTKVAHFTPRLKLNSASIYTLTLTTTAHVEEICGSVPNQRFTATHSLARFLAKDRRQFTQRCSTCHVEIDIGHWPRCTVQVVTRP